MKQFELEYHDPETFAGELAALRQRCDHTGLDANLFQIYSEVLDVEILRGVSDTIGLFFPIRHI